MVFDDNQDAAETLAMALELFAREVMDAHPDAQAFELVGIADPTLTVLDSGLPHMIGYGLARRMRQLPSRASRTFDATTGWGQQKDRTPSFEAGFDHRLTKPVDFELRKPLLFETRHWPCHAFDRGVTYTSWLGSSALR